MKNVVILGASGSVGESACRVVRQFPDRFRVRALVGFRSVQRLVEAAAATGAAMAISADPALAGELARMAPAGVTTAAGEGAILDAVTDPGVDIVVCAIVGTGGLLPTLAALAAGKRVALASKEVMVMAGDLVNAELDCGRGEVIPVDSEHSALFQCLQGRRPDEVKKLWLTASGGAFRDWSRAELAGATLADALAHPVWSMGPKITIDSASLMNKALELVEAKYLFRLPAEKLGVVLHPESVVHSLVELADGALIGHMSRPDMRFAVQYALSYPERWDGELPKLDWTAGLALHFSEPDRERFPSLGFARAALEAGGTLPTVLNAANEVAVERFQAGEIRFTEIWNIVEYALGRSAASPQADLETVLAADREARALAHEYEITSGG